MLRLHLPEQPRPELSVQLVSGTDCASVRSSLLGDLLPVIWHHDDVEQGRPFRGADPDYFELYSEEVGVGVSVLVEPGERLAVLVAEPGRDPHDGGRIGASRVGEQLAQVDVIRLAQLVLNDEDSAM